jgi:hypothetical protein
VLNYYNDTNKEEDSLLDEEIIMTRDSKFPGGDLYNWKIVRRRRKDYKYVGMDRATARACMAEKRAQYLRTFYTWNFKNGEWVRNTEFFGMYKQSVATVTPQRLTGNMWNVRIQVDETCIAYVKGRPGGSEINPQVAVDAACNSYDWSYDE